MDEIIEPNDSISISLKKRILFKKFQRSVALFYASSWQNSNDDVSLSLWNMEKLIIGNR
jgi:hypothetical protein